MSYREEHTKKTLILKITSIPNTERCLKAHEEGPEIFFKALKECKFTISFILDQLNKREDLRTGIYHPDDWELEDVEKKRIGFVVELRKIDGEVSETAFKQILQFQRESVRGGWFLEYLWAGIVNE